MSNWKETKCGKCKIQRAKPNCNTCEGYNKFVPMTNAERIQTMSIEELAEFLVKVETYGYHDQSVSGTLEMYEWLQSESEE